MKSIELVDPKDFPKQGRYGKGVIAWDLPEKVHLVGVVTGKPNHMATIHLTKGAPKSARLDMAAVRKRAATKGDVVVEVKPGEEVVSVNVGWMVEMFVAAPEKVNRKKKESGKRTSSPKGKAAKKAAPVKASANGKSRKSAAKKPAPKTSSPKGKAAKAKPAGKKKVKSKK